MPRRHRRLSHHLNNDLSEIMKHAIDASHPRKPAAEQEQATPSQTLLDIVTAYHASTRRQAWSDAEQHARTGTKLFPNTSYPWVLLATSLRLQERPEDALDALLHALRLEETPEGLFELAHLSMATENKEEAVEAVLLLKERYPDWTEQMLSSLKQ